MQSQDASRYKKCEKKYLPSITQYTFDLTILFKWKINFSFAYFLKFLTMIKEATFHKCPSSDTFFKEPAFIRLNLIHDELTRIGAGKRVLPSTICTGSKDSPQEE